MPSKYFTNYKTAVESSLVEDLYDEAIFIQGFTGYYIPNDNLNTDKLFGDDPIKTYEDAYPLDMYLVNSEYGDTNDFFSKFGLEIRNSVKIQFSVREFTKKIPNTFKRPEEGALIYIPFLRNSGELFEIKFVNTTKDLNVLARTKPYFYELDLELFKLNSNDELNTGIDIIDQIELDNSPAIQLTVHNGTGNYIEDETIYQGISNTNYLSIGTVSSWSNTSNILYIINNTGDFSNTTINIVGDTSNARYIILEQNSRYKDTEFDNNEIHIEALNVLNLPEDNPFGGLSSYE